MQVIHYKAQLLLLLLCAASYCSARSVPRRATLAEVQQSRARPEWVPVRISNVMTDLLNAEKHCPEMDSENPQRTSVDFQGGVQQCRYNAEDVDNSDEMTPRKRKHLMLHIVPHVTNSIQKSTFIRRRESTLLLPEIDQNAVCKNFTIPLSAMRFLNDDVILFVAAGPMPKESSELAVKAESCGTVDGRTVAVAMNFNPAKIMKVKTVTDALIAFATALGVHQCLQHQSVLLHDMNSDGTSYSACLSVKCDKDNNGVVEYVSREDKVKTCKAGEQIFPSLLPENASFICPNVNAVCTKKPSEEKPPITSEPKPVRIVTSVTDLYDWGKHCPMRSRYSTRNRTDFKGNRVVCNGAGDMDSSEILTDAKRALLLKKVVPQAIETYAQTTSIVHRQDSLSVPSFDMSGNCHHFAVSRRQRDEGVQNADLVLYIAAGPMRSEEKDVTLWVEPCATLDGRTVTAAMNINPAKIMSTPDLANVIAKELSLAVETSHCSAKDRAVLPSKTKHGADLHLCVSLKCDADSKLMVRRAEKGESWKQCQDDTQITLDGELTVTCPKYKDVCAASSE